MDRQKKITLFLAFGCLCIVLVIAFCCSSSKPKKVNTSTVKELEEQTQSEITAGKDVYVTDSINDETSAIVTEPNGTVSYWYIYYTAHIKSTDVEYSGYKVIEIGQPYFDIVMAVHAIVPKYCDDDYVGVSFFKRVPFETYKSYKEAK